MIMEYHRPKEIDEAIYLLSRDYPRTVPLGGGNLLSRQRGENFAVVDLQNLGLNDIQADGTSMTIGATATLQDLFSHEATPDTVKEAIRRDATLNMRNTATIAGAIVAGTGESALVTVLLAMDVRIRWLPGEIQQNIGEFLSLKNMIRPGKILISVQVPVQVQVRMTAVGRSPLDPPFLIVAVSKWPSGRTRLVLGGKISTPILGMDGTSQEGIVEAGINACSQLHNQWISENYLKNITPLLIKRLTTA